MDKTSNTGNKWVKYFPEWNIEVVQSVQGVWEMIALVLAIIGFLVYLYSCVIRHTPVPLWDAASLGCVVLLFVFFSYWAFIRKCEERDNSKEEARMARLETSGVNLELMKMRATIRGEAVTRIPHTLRLIYDHIRKAEEEIEGSTVEEGVEDNLEAAFLAVMNVEKITDLASQRDFTSKQRVEQLAQRLEKQIKGRERAKQRERSMHICAPSAGKWMNVI